MLLLRVNSDNWERKAALVEAFLLAKQLKISVELTWKEEVMVVKQTDDFLLKYNWEGE